MEESSEEGGGCGEGEEGGEWEEVEEDEEDLNEKRAEKETQVQIYVPCLRS